MADLNDEAAQTAEQLKKVQEALAALGITVGEVNQAEREALKNTRKNTDALMESQYGVKNFSKAADQGKVAINALAASASAAVKAIYNNQQGTKAFSGTVTGVGTAFSSVTSAVALLFPQFRLLALGANLAGRALINYAKAAAEQSDSLFGTYQALSKSGAAASDGMTGIFQDAQKLGLGFQNLESYTQLIAESSKELALFGGSVFEGRKRFADVGYEMVQYRRGLMNLGMTQEEINDGTVSYIRLQSRLGLTQTKTNEDLARSANAYLQEQDALTKLTGMSRKEQEAAREEIRSQERFAAQLMKVRSTQGDAAATALENTYLVLRNYSKEAAQGFADVSTGMLTTEAAIKSYRATQGESMRTAELVSAGQISAAEGAQRVAAAHGRTVTAMGMTMGAIGTYSSTYGDLTADLRLLAMSEKDIALQLQKIEEDRIKQGAAGNAAADAAVRAQNDMRKAQQDTMLALQKLVNVGVVPVTKLLSGLAKIIDTFALALTKVTNFIGFGVGATKAESPREIELTESKKAADDADLEVRQKEWKVVNAREAADKKIAQTELAAAELALVTAKKRKSAAESAMPQAESVASPEEQSGMSAAGAIATPGGPPAAPPISVNVGPNGAAAPADPTSSLLNLIGKHESGGNYNTLVGGKTEPNLSNMSIAEVLDFQKSMIQKGYESTAVGKYQIINKTLNGLVGRGIAKLDDKFDANTQDKLARGLLEQRGLSQYLVGKISKDQFADNVSKEWASLPYNTGKSYYAGVGSNKSGLDRSEFMSAFARDGGMFNGPRSGYPATLHGAEAVIPLKNGAVPVNLGISDQLKSLSQDSGTNNMETAMQKIVDEFKSTMQATVENIMRSTSSGDGMNAVAGILNEMVSQQKNSNDIQAKILRAAAV